LVAGIDKLNTGYHTSPCTVYIMLRTALRTPLTLSSSQHHPANCQAVVFQM